MEEITRFKNKYIFYNEKKEILVLNSRDTVFIPGLIENQFSDSYGEKIKYIINLLIKQNEKVYLNKVIKEVPILKTKNTKLKKVILHEIKKYYSCYTEFDKEVCSKINNLCFDEDIIADLIYIDDLKQIIRKKEKIKVDVFLIDTLEELDKRLSYKKY